MVGTYTFKTLRDTFRSPVRRPARLLPRASQSHHASQGMTHSRDSSGGYLTGDESERLWDADEEDAYTLEIVEGEDDGTASGLDVSIEAVWARAHTLSNEIAETQEVLDRARSTTIFEPTDLSIDEMQVRLGALARELAGLDDEMEERGLPPDGWQPQPADGTPSAAGPPPPGTPTRSLAPGDFLRPHLTVEEYQLWEWLDQGVLQREVAARLGISQVAVSKREKKLRARVDAIYIEATERPYHWTPLSKSQGGRRRRS